MATNMSFASFPPEYQAHLNQMMNRVRAETEGLLAPPGAPRRPTGAPEQRPNETADQRRLREYTEFLRNVYGRPRRNAQGHEETQQQRQNREAQAYLRITQGLPLRPEDYPPPEPVGSRQARPPAPPYMFSGERIEPLGQDVERAAELARGLNQSYEPAYTAAAGTVQQAARPIHDIFTQNPRNNPYMNPYMSNVIDRIRDEGLRTFNENIRPSLEHTFARAGQHGSSLHQKQMVRAAEGIQRDILARQQHALANQFNKAAEMATSDRERALRAAQQQANIGTLSQTGKLADIEALRQAGLTKQALGQHEKDVAYQDFLRQLNYPLARVSQEANIFNQFRPPVSTVQYEQPIPPPELNLAGQIGSIATQLLGARQMGLFNRGGRVGRRR